VILLRVIAGLDCAYIARLLGKTPGAVRVLSHRGLRRLAGILTAQPATQGASRAKIISTHDPTVTGFAGV
jgi:RNA polymerase sigma-70 factor (ECF subfamily)